MTTAYVTPDAYYCTYTYYTANDGIIGKRETYTIELKDGRLPELMRSDNR